MQVKLGEVVEPGKAYEANYCRGGEHLCALMEILPIWAMIAGDKGFRETRSNLVYKHWPAPMDGTMQFLRNRREDTEAVLKLIDLSFRYHSMKSTRKRKEIREGLITDIELAWNGERLAVEAVRLMVLRTVGVKKFTDICAGIRRMKSETLARLICEYGCEVDDNLLESIHEIQAGLFDRKFMTDLGE